MKNSIAVIGAAGETGRTIAETLAQAGHRILLFDSNNACLNTTLAEIKASVPNPDIEIMECERESSWEADIIILTVPPGALPDVAERIRVVTTRKMVIFVPESVGENANSPIADPLCKSIEKLAGLLPYSRLLSAFNTTDAVDSSRPGIASTKSSSLITLTDDEGVANVCQLVKKASLESLRAKK